MPSFDRTVPQVALGESHAGNETVRLHRAKHATRLGIDLEDAPALIQRDPQTSLGPSEARIVRVWWRGDDREHVAGRGIDLLNFAVGDLVEVAPIERGARVGAHAEGATERAVRRHRLEAIAHGDPRIVAVVGDAVDMVDAGERSVLGEDLGPFGRFRPGHVCFLARSGPMGEQQCRRETFWRACDPTTVTPGAVRVDFAGVFQLGEPTLHGSLAEAAGARE